tara:strand:+ start:1962 stop:2102 length:141 start_codon:yes stop_codon:yes gene_type:complete
MNDSVDDYFECISECDGETKLASVIVEYCWTKEETEVLLGVHHPLF